MDDFEKNLLKQITNGHPKSFLKKDGTPKKKRGTKKKVVKKEMILASDISQAGKSRRAKTNLNQKQREAIRKQLVQFYGSSKVDRYFLNCSKIAEVSERLCSMRDMMEKEIVQAEEDQEQYFKDIDNEYQKVGRPNAPFSWKELDFLCSIGCPLGEIAGFFDLTKETLQKKVRKEYEMSFGEYHDRRSQGIKISVRRAQIQSAIGGSDTMLKFLGINLLGQKNKIEFEGHVQVNTFADLVKNLDDKLKKKEKDIENVDFKEVTNES